MSNRKNNKSNKGKKTSYKNHSQNDFNSFRMEALEPRLLMVIQSCPRKRFLLQTLD